MNTIVSAAHANSYILTTARTPSLIWREVHIVDLGMPRTIDPGLQSISADIAVLDLDGIKNWNRQGLCHFYAFYLPVERLPKHMPLYEKITHNFQGWNTTE